MGRIGMAAVTALALGACFAKPSFTGGGDDAPPVDAAIDGASSCTAMSARCIAADVLETCAGAGAVPKSMACSWGCVSTNGAHCAQILRNVAGVVDTEVGYVAGAESVRVVFDPTIVSYATLLERWYFRMHDPTTKHRQGNDVGAQYRSAIFFMNDAQRATAEEVKERVDASGKWKAPIVTEIVAATEFTVGEGFHQDFLQREPDGYTCHYLRD